VLVAHKNLINFWLVGSIPPWTTMFKKTIVYEISFHRVKKILDELPVKHEAAGSRHTISGFPLFTVANFASLFRQKMQRQLLTGVYRIRPPFDQDGVLLRYRC